METVADSVAISAGMLTRKPLGIEDGYEVDLIAVALGLCGPPVILGLLATSAATLYTLLTLRGAPFWRGHLRHSSYLGLRDDKRPGESYEKHRIDRRLSTTTMPIVTFEFTPTEGTPDGGEEST